MKGGEAEKIGLLTKIKALGLRRSSGKSAPGLVRPNMEGSRLLSGFSSHLPQPRTLQRQARRIYVIRFFASGSTLPPERRSELALPSQDTGKAERGASLAVGELLLEGRNDDEEGTTDAVVDKLSPKQLAVQNDADRRQSSISGKHGDPERHSISSGSGLREETWEIPAPSHKDIQNLAEYYRGRSR